MNCNELQMHAEKIGINLDSEALQRFSLYSELLIEWNKKINLTAITIPEEIQIKHFLDSLLLFKCNIIKEDSTVIDIGTGAGFPGVPLKIAYPNIKLTLMDSLNKRLFFLKELLLNLEIKANLIHSRAEEMAKQKEYREKFDIVSSRAVAPLNILTEYCLPYVKVGGVFAAMKGPTGKDEVLLAQNAIKLLGGEIEDEKDFSLPDKSKRIIVIIRKAKNTPNIYPRQGNKISKAPL